MALLREAIRYGFSQLNRNFAFNWHITRERPSDDDAVFYFDDIRIIESPADAASATRTTHEYIFPLLAGRTIVQEQKYYSACGDHYLIFQPDGNVAVYTTTNQHVWDIASETNRYTQEQSVKMERDGNFVVRGANDEYIWSALHENPDPSAFLTLTPEGVLQLVSGVLASFYGPAMVTSPQRHPLPPRELN